MENTQMTVDLNKLEALARAAYIADERAVAMLQPATVLDLIAQARAQQAGAAPNAMYQPQAVTCQPDGAMCQPPAPAVAADDVMLWIDGNAMEATRRAIVQAAAKRDRAAAQEAEALGDKGGAS
jgi:hypothetical protein